MSINKRVRKAMLGISIGAIVLLMLLSLGSIFTIRNEVYYDLSAANEKITKDNTEDMLNMSLRLAQATAQLNSRRIAGEFSVIRSELETLKGDIENLYNSNGLIDYPINVTRCEEYVVSQMADISDDEIDRTVSIMKGSTSMFDNVLANDSKLDYAYVVMENGVVFSCTDTFYPEVEQADMRTRDWYKNAVEAGGVCWSEIYLGISGDNYITIAAPVYDLNGDLFGVTAFDFNVTEISDKVLKSEAKDFTDAYIKDTAGNILLSTKSIDEKFITNGYSNYLSSVDPSGLSSGCYTTDELIVGFADIAETGWRLYIHFDYDEVLEPVEKVAATVGNVSEAVSDNINKVVSGTILVFIVFIVVLLLVAFFASKKLAKNITAPIEALAAGANEIGGGNIDYVIPDLGQDEIGALANTFNGMTKRLHEYIDNLTTVTAEKERIGAELDVATHIQSSMLPSIFPKFSNSREFRIFATMTPAKEVGGDFYDFFMVDERHLAIVMADVSGKGVPAALFMVIGKTLIKDHTQPGRQLGDVFTKVNNMLCESNSEGLFITAFEGVLDLDTGDFDFVNAGHEMPFIMKSGGSFEVYKIRPGFVLAGMEDMKFRAGHMQLDPGDRLFQYTDGVTEATSAEFELFGMERLEKSLNDHRDFTPEELLPAVKQDIDSFVGEAPQFDDITMLCLDYFGKAEG
ncbi:MAG: SpoIIE family protein phosphatase [Eubacteriales bacterium]|nr:SpoIIE family protein phosphatase [Eubacteriales bacterium]